MTAHCPPSRSGAGVRAGEARSRGGAGDLVQFTTRVVAGATIVAACGEIDASNAEQFCRQVHWRAPVGYRALVIDLGAVSFFSGQGVRALLAIAQRCDAAALPWAVIASPAVARTLHLTDLPENAVHQARSVPAALSALLTAHKQ